MDMPKPDEKSFAIPKLLVWEAWRQVKANKGAPGVDGQALDEFEADLADNLYKVWNRMSSGTWFPPPVRAVEIPKPHGPGTRVLGVPTIADRVAQTATAMFLEPLVEPRFHPDSYGYRPKKSAHDAVGVCRQRCWKYDWVIDLDVQKFFDTVPWDLVVRAVEAVTDCRWVLLYVRRWLRAPLQRPDGTLVQRDKGTPQGSAMTAPTQKVTWVIGACGGRDRVADRDGVVVAADLHFAHDEPQDPLLAGGVELVQTVGEAAEEPVERVGELEVGLGVVQLGIEAVELGLQRCLAFAQRGHPAAEFLERDQLFLVGLDQAGDCLVGAGEVALERVTAAGGGVLGPHRGEAAVDLGAHECGVLQQPADLGPDERVELISADRAAGAPLAVGVPPAVLADAAVVADPLVRGSGGGAVAGVAALAADEHALQERQLLGVALGEARVVDQARLREGERLLGHERRDRDQRPLLGRLVVAGQPTAVALAALAGGARRAAVPLGGLRLPERGVPAIGRVAQHRPDRRAVPARLAGLGLNAPLGQPARELTDRDAISHVAVEHVAYDLRLGLVDLPEPFHMIGALHVPVAVGRARHHRLGAATGAMQLPAAGALGDLRTLVLGDHPLELTQQLILRGATPLGLLGEHDLHAERASSSSSST